MNNNFEIDLRNINNGLEIPSKTYSDQPYVIVTNDDSWLCVMTTGENKEGQRGQHIVTTKSKDLGKTWSDLKEIESPDGPEASYAVLLKNNFGRIYCFYNHNSDNIREIIADNPPYKDGKCTRVDSLGYHVFKYSDDNGNTWSNKRYKVPLRNMEIDRSNPYKGKIQFFWNVGKPFILNGHAYISIHKVGSIGNGFFTRSEGVLIKSDNLNYEKDPDKINWETLPEGDCGLRAPKGGNKIAEEHSYVTLSDQSIYSIYRTTDGHPARSYSRDFARTWEEPEYERYSNGNLIKNPRAANFVWKCSDNKYLYWFHNHGGNWYEDRNPAWLCGGIEIEKKGKKYISWSEPEIILYDDDPYIRMSYPDFLEYKNKYYLFETNKDKARVHELNKELIEGLWKQFESKTSISLDSCILNQNNPDSEINVPYFKDCTKRNHLKDDFGTLDLRNSITIEFLIKYNKFEKNINLINSRSNSGQGICIKNSNKKNIEIVLNDGRTQSNWESDYNILNLDIDNHIIIIIDGGPKIISFVVNGVLCDGGIYRQFGWSRFNPNLKTLNSNNYNWVVAPGVSNNIGDPSVIEEDRSEKYLNSFIVNKNKNIEIKYIRIYQKSLSISESINNYRNI